MCGIFGIDGHQESARLTYLGLYALQHRGQESAGLVAWDGKKINLERGMGEVADIFNDAVLARLSGHRAIGHTRYSTAGASSLANAQPIVVQSAKGPFALIHNGNLINGQELRERLETEGAVFQTSSDTEVILHLMARHPYPRVVDSFKAALEEVRGAYSLLLLTADELIAARDPHGFRPLIQGELEGSVCFASESCALDLLGARAVRELDPGEIMVARRGEVESYRLSPATQPRRCLFELVYFARPDSQVFDNAVSAARTEMGAVLARESPVAADLIVPVPDSGLFSALGYSRAAGLPFEFALIRNHYIGRTFIQPEQTIRDFGVRVKLNPVRSLLADKRVVLVDDSIVRGTTSRKIVRMVREAGATEVHLRITSPPTRWPCLYGINTPSRKELIAAQKDVREITEYIEADSLAYLSLDGMLECVKGAKDSFCHACWTGEYPLLNRAEQSQQMDLFAVSEEDQVATTGARTHEGS